MTLKTDVIKIESWHKLGDILKAYGPLGALLDEVTQKMENKPRVDLLQTLVQACITTYQDDHAVVILEALARAAGSEFGPHLYKYLEQVYWNLPMTRLQEPPETVFLKTRLYICAKLISEWKVEQTERSQYAFRRLIAMGWPVSKNYALRKHEHVVEIQARGRSVSEEERKGIRDIIRTYMDNFSSFEERKAGPDAVFGHWLVQDQVPEAIRDILVVARAKMGGSDLALRDIRNAAVFRGLPDVALERIQDVVGPVRQMMKICEEIRKRLVAKIQEGSPRWRPDLAPLGWKLAFPNINHIEIKVGPIGDPGQVMADIGVIIAELKMRGPSTWQLTMVVEESAYSKQEPVKVTATWAMA